MNTENKVEKREKLYQSVSLKKAEKLSKELTKFLKTNDLIIEIAGKNYVPVEGWQFLGTQLGLTEVVQVCEPVETDDPKEFKYKAVVEIINQQGTVISRGFAWCTSKERKKSSFEEYAVASMAQTRAVGKAYRNFLAWIVKMGGYEGTPAEEVDKDMVEKDLSKAKQNIVKAMREAGIHDSQDMMATIQQAVGKDVVENTDDVQKVMDLLRKEA